MQISGNETHVSRSLHAADSGMAFTKYHLANLGIPPGTTSTDLFGEVYNRLVARLATTTNNSVPLTVGLSADLKTILIPGSGDPYVWLDDKEELGLQGDHSAGHHRRDYRPAAGGEGVRQVRE